MSDDFLQDLSNAVETSGDNTLSLPTTAEPQQYQQKPQEIQSDVEQPHTVADELSQFFDDADPYHIEEPALEEPTVVDEPEEPEEPKQVVQKEKPQNRTKPSNERLLDTFLDEDEEGNLIDASGEVIALAGKSRTYYEGLKNEARKQRGAANDLAVQNLQLSQKFKDLYDEYKGIKSNATSPVQSIVTETGLNDTDATAAIQLMQQYKTDPIGAIKSLLTQAAQSGIDVGQIGANVSVDPALMQKQFDQALERHIKPLTEAQLRDRAHQEAVQEATQFLETFPEAVQYETQIAQAKGKFPQMSLAEIWMRLRRELDKQPERQPQQRQRQPQQRQPVQRQKVRRQKVRAPRVDYSTMNYDEIAQSILKENR